MILSLTIFHNGRMIHFTLPYMTRCHIHSMTDAALPFAQLTVTMTVTSHTYAATATTHAVTARVIWILRYDATAVGIQIGEAGGAHVHMIL
mmetsp:Transcript_21718/g.33036  ORF Transcript_21718/g.33036 Transcript_21718/m.33036 type:complete len:91 (+) Transcript_21718:70-342(+)